MNTSTMHAAPVAADAPTQAGPARSLAARVRERLHRHVEAWKIARLDRRVGEDARRLRARLASTPGARGLFIDCGANIGQGSTWFAERFPGTEFDYVLVEPNPHCAAALARHAPTLGPATRVIGAAASTREGEMALFGLSEPDGAGSLSEGASLEARHNDTRYVSDAGAALRVPVFRLADAIGRWRRDYPMCIVKLDIEGHEYEVLEDLLRSDALGGVDAMYVEFHSKYRRGKRLSLLWLEHRLVGRIARAGTLVRRWI